MAQRVVHQVAQVLAPDCAPLLLTDGFRDVHDGLTDRLWPAGWRQPRRQAIGPAPKPRWMPLPGAVVCAGGQDRAAQACWSDVTHRVVFGTLGAVKAGTGGRLGWHINTAFVERVNLTIRQHVAAVGRRVSTLCKGEEGLGQQLALHHVYYTGLWRFFAALRWLT